MSVESWFSDTYTEAREKFVSAAAHAGATITGYVHPLKGPDGETLVTDVASVGAPDARKLVVTMSATHGVEGFCGSGCQTGLFATDLTHALPGDTALVQVHAHNPYGFAHGRRVTEGNVDLNRNFVDFSQPLPVNAGYDRIHGLVVPARWTRPTRLVADVTIAAYVATHGLAAFQDALTAGQYKHPDGLFFGGREATWSHRTSREVIKTHVAGHEHVAVLDFHTGLGRRGHCELIVDGSESDPGYRRAREWYGGEVRSPAQGDSVSAAVTGTIGSAYRDVVGPDHCTLVTLEYGTRSGFFVLRALMADNWLHLHGEVSSEEGRRIKRQIRQAFYGEDRRWKQQVWTRAHDVVRTTLARLAAV